MPYDPQTGEYIPDMGQGPAVNAPASNPFGFDPGQATRDYLAGIANPQTLTALLGAEAAARPALGGLGLKDIGQYSEGVARFDVNAFLAARPDILNNFNNAKDDYSRMYGGLEQYAKAAADAENLTANFTVKEGGSIDFFNALSKAASGAESAANTAVRTAATADINALAPQLAATYNQLNPEVLASLKRAEALSAPGADPYAGMRSAVENARQFGDLSFTPAQAALLGNAPQVGLGGYDAAQTSAESYNPAMAQSGGYQAERAAAQNYNAALGNFQGYAAERAAAQNYNAALANSQGYTAERAAAQDYNAALAKSQGYTAERAAAQDYNAALAKSQGYTAERANFQGYNAAQTAAQGYIAEQAGSQGYNTQGYTPDSYNAAQAATGMQTEAERLARGKLGESLYAQALQAGPSAAAQLLGGRAAQFAASTGQLSPEELRNIQQGTREAYAARGIEMSNPAIAAEAAARSAAMRQRQAEDLAQAVALNQAYTQDLTTNRNFGTGLYGQEIGLQQSNQQAALQAALANQQANQNVTLANVGATNTASQFNTGLKADASQFGANAANQASQFAANAANQVALANQLARNTSNQFGADASNQANALNQAATNTANQFSTNAANQAALQNALLSTNANQFGADSANQVSLANQLATNTANQFSTNAVNQAALQNALLGSNAGQFGADAANQSFLANQLATNTANQFSTNARNQAALQNALLSSNAGQFGADAANQVSIANQLATNTANQFSTNAVNQAGLQNALLGSNAGQFSADAANQMFLANQLATNTANQFSTNSLNQAALQNALLGSNANQFGADARNQMFLANQLATNTANQFGANARNQANTANQSATNAARIFGADAANQTQLTNAELIAKYAVANQGAANQFSLANQLAQMDVNAQNRTFSADQAQKNITNLGVLGQAGANRALSDRDYAATLAQGYRNAAYDPMSALLGQTSNAAQTAGQQQNYVLDLAKMFNTPTTYNPDTGINLALANNANVTNKSIAETAAAAQLAAAKASASATKTSGVASGLGNILGAAVSTKVFFKCIPEGELIDTPEGQVAIEDIRSGDSVIGFSGEPVKVLIKHEYAENPEAERFHRFYLDNGKNFSVCDMHRIEGERSMDCNVGNSFKGGEVVEAIAVYGGVNRSYDLLTEDIGYRMSGVAVNSMIEELAAFSSNL